MGEHFGESAQHLQRLLRTTRNFVGRPEQWRGRCPRRQLARLGVELHTGKPVTEIGANVLEFVDQRIAARTILWAAGVAA